MQKNKINKIKQNCTAIQKKAICICIHIKFLHLLFFFFIFFFSLSFIVSSNLYLSSSPKPLLYSSPAQFVSFHVLLRYLILFFCFQKKKRFISKNKIFLFLFFRPFLEVFISSKPPPDHSKGQKQGHPTYPYPSKNPTPSRNRTPRRFHQPFSTTHLQP